MVSMGNPPKWYGGLVVEQLSEDGARTIAFDDGDVRTVSDLELQQLLAAQPTALVKSADPTHGGVVANQSGLLQAERVLWFKKKKGSTVTTTLMGTFLGSTDEHLGGSPLYQAFILKPDAYPPQQPSSRPTRNSSRASSEAPTAAAGKGEQDRYGFHSFRRGDTVEWTAGKTTDVPCTATVYGVCEYNETRQDVAVHPNQDRKALALRCHTTSLFFVGGWPSWKRVTMEPGRDPDDDDQVVTMSSEESAQMVADCRADNTYSRLSTFPLLAGASKKIPPWVDDQRKKKVKDDAVEAKKKRKAEAEAEARIAEAEAEAEVEEVEVEEVEEVEEMPKPKPKLKRVAAAQPRSSTRQTPPQPTSQPSPEKPRDPPRGGAIRYNTSRDENQHSPPSSRCTLPDTPPSLAMLKRQLQGMQRAQHMLDAPGLMRLGELEFDIKEREKKRCRYNQ